MAPDTNTIPNRPDLPLGNGTTTLVKLAMIVIVVAALYFGSDIFVPLALAILLAFALAPAVQKLRRLSVPNLPAVLTVVTVAFLAILAFGWVLTLQAVDLAQQLPSYRTNIEAKIDSLLESPPGGRLYERAADMVRDLGRKIEGEDKEAAPVPGTSSAPAEEEKPVVVEMREPPLTSFQIIRTVIGPLVSPLATAGIVIVFVIFMLLEREDLRDRFIRLAGWRDLPRTTQAINDAGRRVGRYLLMQLVVNTTYAIPIGIGLWLIGLPNPILWGMLCGLLRFVPYIGPIVAAFFPLALALAVDPGWSTFLLAGAWFVLVELVSNNIVEPLLYGASTGLSPIAIIAAAVFWTWLWGPIGLLLSTPLTVCLVVLGRHVPQLAFLDVLLGSEPVLEPAELLYQRLLVGDPIEATERAEEYLTTSPLIKYYDEVAMPALTLAEQDRATGRLSDDQLVRVGESALTLVDNLSEWEEPDEPPARKEGDEEAIVETVELPRLDGTGVLCIGARGALDDAAAGILADSLARGGADVRLLRHDSLRGALLGEADLGSPEVVPLSYMNTDSLAHARLLVRRLRRRLPEAKVVLCFWTFSPAEMERRDPVASTRADAVAITLEEAIGKIGELAGPDESAPSAEKLSLAASG
jgi:predicted PurR-regulated permease PerM